MGGTSHPDGSAAGDRGQSSGGTTGSGTGGRNTTGAGGSGGSIASGGSIGAGGSGGTAGRTTQTGGTGGTAGAVVSPTGGTGGATATGGVPGTGGATTGDQSVLQRGHDLYRRATYTQPALTKAAAATMAPDTAFNANAKFTGGLQGSVLYVQQGPAAAGCPAAATGCQAKGRAAGAGLFFVASQNGGVYAFDEASGMVVWQATLPGGGDGVRGTPAIDGPSRTMFVAMGASGHHEVHALGIDDGVERAGWPVRLSGTNLTKNGISFNTGDQNEHAALI
ncbi:MAG: hypothetical protein ABUS79_30265, partial [Pseudomonadota bacterium]